MEFCCKHDGESHIGRCAPLQCGGARRTVAAERTALHRGVELLAEDACVGSSEQQPSMISEAAASPDTKRVEQLQETTNDVVIAKSKKGRLPAIIPAHIQRVTNTDGALLYHCTKCGKSFASRTQQYYHVACGSENKKYKCGQCNKTFSTHSHLKYHMESHFAHTHHCKQCNKIFSNRIVLRKHERLHQHAPAIKCGECTKLFRDKGALKVHIQQHRKDYKTPFQCAFCEKGYALKSTLQQHMLKHTEKKHKCSFCDKCFQRNSTLKLHLKRHSKTTSFICKTCCKPFSDANVLLRHARLHESSIKYRCIRCDITTGRKDNMLRHLRNIHPDEDLQTYIKVDALTLHLNMPKTVENSSVIKCIGNVEPVKIPSALNETNKEQVSIGAHSTVDEAFTLTSLETYNLNLNCNSAAAVVQKKTKRKYDPIEMYRKILTSDCEGSSEGDSETLPGKITAVDSPHSLEKRTDSQRVSFNTSNFSEMHWRKNFKYTYEYQEY